MRFWIDVANSPHAPFFAPISRRLCERGHDVRVTAWDRAQTAELALAAWPDVVLVGFGSRRDVLAKGLRIVGRARALRDAVRSWRPDVALGHNSYAQILAARWMSVPAVTMMDYEHQPANHLAFRLARRVLVPDRFPLADVRRLGAAGKVTRYRGLKEDIALADFTPDPGFRHTIDVGQDEVLAVCRPAPEGALYHRHGNALLDAAVDRAARANATVLLSPRDAVQAVTFRRRWGVRVLDHAVDGANLLFHADLVIGAGGTMTREAAAMRTPSYTLFAGRMAAVDRSLIDEGRIVWIHSAGDLDRIEVRRKPANIAWRPDPACADRIVDLIEESAEVACSPR